MVLLFKFPGKVWQGKGFSPTQIFFINLVLHCNMQSVRSQPSTVKHKYLFYDRHQYIYQQISYRVVVQSLCTLSVNKVKSSRGNKRLGYFGSIFSTANKVTVWQNTYQAASTFTDISYEIKNAQHAVNVSVFNHFESYFHLYHQRHCRQHCGRIVISKLQRGNEF